MNLIYTLGKNWLKSYVHLPHASTDVPGTENAKFDDDAFMNFSPDMKRNHLPDSGGSYLSRFTNITSHIILTIVLKRIRGIVSLSIYEYHISYNINHCPEKNNELQISLSYGSFIRLYGICVTQNKSINHMHNETSITAR